MHTIISWDIKAEGDEWEALNTSLRNCLDGYSWVKPLTTFYVVQLDDASERQELKDCLTEVCRANPKKINLIIAPAMEGGSYGGWLPKTLWPKIKQRTT